MFHKKIKIFGINSSNIEIRDLAKAWIAISIAFGIVLSPKLDASIINYMILAAISVGIGFIIHEMAHKVIAQKYHCWAEFRANNQMLIFAILISFLGFVFAAPGAVMIMGHVDHKQNGKISVAGPLANLIVALVFFTIAGYTTGFIALVSRYGFLINSWLALFNLLPFGIFDGRKVLRWDKKIYGIMIGTALFFVFFGNMLL